MNANVGLHIDHLVVVLETVVAVYAKVSRMIIVAVHHTIQQFNKKRHRWNDNNGCSGLRRVAQVVVLIVVAVRIGVAA
jgi:hypothetical protein